MWLWLWLRVRNEGCLTSMDTWERQAFLLRTPPQYPTMFNPRRHLKKQRYHKTLHDLRPSSLSQTEGKKTEQEKTQFLCRRPSHERSPIPPTKDTHSSHEALSVERMNVERKDVIVPLSTTSEGALKDGTSDSIGKPLGDTVALHCQ